MPVRVRVAFVALPMLAGVSASFAAASSYEAMFIRQSSLGLAELKRDAAEPLPDLSLIVDSNTVDMTVVEPSLLKRMFRALGTAVAPDAALADTQTAGKSKGKMVEEGDSNFQLWQKMANEALKGEQTLRETPPHKLALEHPDQYVVVCEAGCRKANEEIVYAVAKVEARAVITALETTSAAAGSGSQPVDTMDKRVQSPDTILCIAGCYDSPREHAARSKSAEAVRPVQKFAAAPVRPAAVPSTHAKAVLRTVAAIAPVAKPTSVRRVELASARPWQTRVVYETPAVRHVAAVQPVDVQRHVIGAWHTKLIRTPAAKLPVLTAAKTDVPAAWRTKIVYASQSASANRHASAHGKLADIKHFKAAFAPLRKARVVQYAVVETRY